MAPPSLSGDVAARLLPVPDAAALLLDPGDADGPRTLVVSDVHLGLGGNRERPAGPPEASAGRMAEELVQLAEHTRADAILIAGDIKHPIVGTPPSLRPVVFEFFARLLSERVAVEVVLGNHDVGLVRYLPKEVVVHPGSGVVRSGVGVFHGHRWPSDTVLRSRRLVAGHLHPGFRLAATAEDPEGKRRCWVRAELVPPPAPKRRRRHALTDVSEIVVLPAFNPIAGVESLNRERPKRGRSFLYRRFLGLGHPRAYLLDGTDLGPLPTSYPVDPPQGGGRGGARGQ